MSDGFIQFGDGEAVPVTDIEWTFTKNGPEVEEVFKLPRVSDFEIMLPVPPEASANICRLVGAPEMADRIEIAHHPDLAELDLQMDGYYDA